MARYRSKDDVDLRWNRIRRRLTRELDCQIADWREEALNHLLGGAWEQFKDALQQGKMVELESSYASWVTKALTEAKVGDGLLDEAD
jgi:hypothetical protein